MHSHFEILSLYLLGTNAKNYVNHQRSGINRNAKGQRGCSLHFELNEKLCQSRNFDKGTG